MFARTTAEPRLVVPAAVGNGCGPRLPGGVERTDHDHIGTRADRGAVELSGVRVLHSDQRTVLIHPEAALIV